MSLPLTVDKKSPTSVYRQIVERITELIRDGGLKGGDTLPSERELANSLGIARGTVTRAYTELSRASLIDMIRGRGSVVRAGALGSERKERAAELVASLVDTLSGLRFSLTDIKAMVDLAILEREERLLGLNVAAVDCNPETLGMFERQIGILSHVSVKKFLLHELAGDPDPARRLGDFDLILTTSTHREELAAMAPVLEGRIVPVAVSLSRETVLSLAAVKPGASIGVLCRSRQFLSIVESRLRELRIGGPVEALFSPRKEGELARFAGGRLVLVTPPAGGEAPTRDEARALEKFTQEGGLLVQFDYRIERGSLVFVEERIRSLVREKEGKKGGAAAPDSVRGKPEARR